MEKLKELAKALDEFIVKRVYWNTIEDADEWYKKVMQLFSVFQEDHVQEGDDNKLLVIQAVTKLRAKEEQLEGKVLIDRKQLSDLMKRQPLPEAFRWISDFKSQYQHWTKKLKELLEK